MRRCSVFVSKESRFAKILQRPLSLFALMEGTASKRSRVSLVLDDEEYREGIAWVKKERGRTLSRGELLSCMGDTKLTLPERNSAAVRGSCSLNAPR